MAAAPDGQHRSAAGRPAPTFIACGARSGSTVLRWLIDSHPHVACPGESDIALLLERFARSATALSSPAATDAGPRLRRARDAADTLIDGYLSASGKTHLCDKSLSNALHLDALASTWPDARFILLHRQPMDFVISAIEASPWGLSGYGFAEFAQKSPTDTVLALIAYWLDRTKRLLAFEHRFADRCLRLRYEDLVTRTEESLAGVWELIGVAPPARPANAAFEAPHDPQAAADHKVWYTDDVHEHSLGRGARVPPQLVSGVVRTSVNELAERLEYPQVDDYWGSGGSAPAEAGEQREQCTAGAEGLIELRILEGHALHWRGVVDLAGVAQTDAASARCPARTARVVVVERATLAALASGSENIGAALRARNVRSYGPRLRDYAEERELFRRLVAFLAAGGADSALPDAMPAPALTAT
jgi:hypothetical protein